MQGIKYRLPYHYWWNVQRKAICEGLKNNRTFLENCSMVANRAVRGVMEPSNKCRSSNCKFIASSLKELEGDGITFFGNSFHSETQLCNLRRLHWP